jgi:hypothetical protein
MKIIWLLRWPDSNKVNGWTGSNRWNSEDACDAEPGSNGGTHAEKLEPQPQLLVELGLMKLKPWRMRVSSKSRTMPAR